MAIKRGEDGNIIESKTEIAGGDTANATRLSLIHISEPTRPY